MEMRLVDVKPGMRARVTCVDVSGGLEGRLRDFGFVPGTEIICRYRSADGGLTALELRGTVLALRTADLNGIRVRC